MSTASVSRSEASSRLALDGQPGHLLAEAHADSQRILVWDLPVRVFHWSMVLCFAGAWLSAESERWRLVHVTLGYTMAGLVAFRLVWGLVGTRYARFANFVRGPKAIWRYLRSLLGSEPEHPVGHNPAGGLAIVGMLVLTLLVTASGWAVYEDWGPHLLEDLHEGAAEALLVLVAVHVAGVAVASVLHHENLVTAMFTGLKRGRAQDAIRRAWGPLGAVMLMALAGFWLWQGLGTNLG